MAGTRRQARARDTANTNQRQRSASQVASIAPETAIAASSTVVKIAESADEASSRPESSPQPGTPINRSTTAFCKKCNGKIGEFYNSWHKATSSYYSPALLGSYRSLLQTSDQRIEASDSTELAGCIIHLTYCPSCNNYLGFIVVDTPAGGKRLFGREFFKLQHIGLRCETSSGETITVEPQENEAPDLVAPGGLTSPSPTPARTATTIMELDTPLSSSHPLWGQTTQEEPLHQRQQSLSSDTMCQSLPFHRNLPPAAAPPRSPITQNVARLAPAVATILPPKSPQPAQLQSANTAESSAPTAQSTSTVNGLKDGRNYPRDPREVHFDAIERLQTQTSQNTSALAAQARTQMESAEIVRQIESSLRHEFQSQLQKQDQELLRMNDVVNQLSRDLQECHRNMMTLVQEVRVNRAESVRRSSEAMQPSYQDDALELMARRIGDVSHRTTDLETMRDHVAILSGRVQRLESESTVTSQQHPPPHQAHPSPQHVHQPVHSAPINHTAPHPNQAPQFQTPARPSSISLAVKRHEQPATAIPPESAQRREPAPTQNGWTTINAGEKRVFENGTDSSHQGTSPARGDSKRPKLTNRESHDDNIMAQRPPEPSQILPSQTQPVVTSQSLAQPAPYPGSQQGPYPGAYPAPPPSQPYPYSVQGSPSEQNWHADPQHMGDVRPSRGRGSRGGRGPGSRGGRVRKSMQGQQHPVETPEWERGWSAVADSHGSPSSFEEQPAHPPKSIMRRGGGGSGARGGAILVERSGEWTPEIGPRNVFHDRDSPIEVKKTRSKPIRNEEGILVRKDGRPDRRSQSSAANLRKVHARKEGQQREAEAGPTPTGLHASMSAGPDTPSPTTRRHPESDVTDSVRKKHNAILGRIFPDGLDDSRKQHDYAHQVFHEDRDHTAHPRTQVSRTAKQIKKEQVDQGEIAETQAQADGDVEMGDAEHSKNGHANEDSQTPNSEAIDAPQQGKGQDTREDINAGQESRVQVPETQASDGSVTLTAESVEAA